MSITGTMKDLLPKKRNYLTLMSKHGGIYVDSIEERQEQQNPKGDSWSDVAATVAQATDESGNSSKQGNAE